MSGRFSSSRDLVVEATAPVRRAQWSLMNSPPVFPKEPGYGGHRLHAVAVLFSTGEQRHAALFKQGRA
ncbi:MAG: hypothetical protein ACTHKR_01345, partial [Sphingomonas sp.]